MRMSKKALVGCPAAALAALLALWLASGFIGAAITMKPWPADIETRKAIGGKPVEDVSIRTSDGLTLSAWHVRHDPEKAVILLAGITANRRCCVSRAEYYLELGYSVLLPDLRATGKSEGDRVTLGWHERKDLAACFQYLRDGGYRRVGADGISLGAATICYALQDVDNFAFIVLESSYDTIESAFSNRLDLYSVPHFVGWPALWFFALRIGARPSQLRPVDYMPLCEVPALIMGGDAEDVLRLSETEDIYNRCASKHKRLCIFKGGKHENFLGRFPEQYKSALREFLEEASRPASE